MIVRKYKLKPGLNEIRMQEHADVLCTQIQDDSICIWTYEDPMRNDLDLEKRKFLVINTGDEYPDNETLKYIGTVQTKDLYVQIHFVWHVFEIIYRCNCDD